MTGETKRQLVDDLMIKVTELQAVSDQVDQAVSDRLGLNRTDARCLSYLIISGSMTAGELAAAAAVAPTALTFVIDRLVRAGYAERVRDPADRRRVLVEAAEPTRRFAEEVWGQVVVETERQLQKYTTRDLQLILGFLRDQVDLQQRHADRIRERS